MVARASDEWSLRGYKAVVLENEEVRVTILPELGAKIHGIHHLRKGRDVLWHNPRVPIGKVPFGSRFDDVWSGGWDEIFPNDAESTVGGERYPDMGEVWSLPWEYSVDEKRNEASATTKVACPISPVEVSRKVTMRRGEPGFDCEYEFVNLGGDEVRFLWKIHPAFEINGGCEISVPASAGFVDPRYASRFAAARYPWPRARYRDGKTVDVGKVVPEARTCTLHYLTGLREGAAAFTDRENGVRSTIEFQKDVMDNVWLFLAYGGWRGVRNAVIEPSTSYPYDLAEAIRRGHASRLEGGGRLRAKVSFRLDELGASEGK
jgi:galactose mutarotase-like enzyme